MVPIWIYHSLMRIFFFFFIEYSDSNTILDKHEVLYQNNQHKREVTHIILLRVQLIFFSF